jgi:hypothetical protein
LLVDIAGLKPFGAGGDAAIARIVKRHSGAYVLRAFQLLTDNYGDVRAGLIARTIHIANTGHLDPRTEAGRRIAGPDGILPDELRRPIGIKRLSESTGLPFESTRRIVQRLVNGGHCVRVEGGVIVPAEALARPEHANIVITNFGYLRRFVRDLEALGLVGDPAIVWPSFEGEIDEGAVARSVARVTAEYFLRALQLLASTYGDIRSGIVAQTIVAANTDHLDARGGDGWRYAGIDAPAPDSVRKPVNVARLAESLDQPYETMRSQVQRLVSANLCTRVDGGVIVPGAVLESPGAVRAMLANVAHVRKLVRDLASLGASWRSELQGTAAPRRLVLVGGTARVS